jgi:hypothetical protein
VATKARTSRSTAPAAAGGETQDAVAARVNRRQAEVAAAAREAAERQDAVAARVNRQQAAAAAEARAEQEATARGMGARGMGAREMADRGVAAVRSAARPFEQVATLPVAVGQRLAEDVGTAARRPDMVLYWAGLAGLAALGALEWPAAAAVGVGVALASRVRRAPA